MDPVTIVFYAVVCACLGWAAPRLGRAPLRFAIGAIVGIVAALILPSIRAGLGL